MLEPVHRDPSLDEQPVDLGDGVALGALRQGDVQPVGPHARRARRTPSPRAGRPPARGRSTRPAPRRRTRRAAGRSVPAGSPCPGPRWPRRHRCAPPRRADATTAPRCGPRPPGTWIMSRISSMPPGSRPFIGSSRISSCGVPEQAGGHAQPLAHPHGVLRHLVVGPVQDADALECRLDAALCRRLTGRGEDLEVLPAGEVAVEAGLVDDGPDPGQRQVAVAGDGVAEQRHRPGVGMGQARAAPGSASSSRRRSVRDSRRRSPGGRGAPRR